MAGPSVYIETTVIGYRTALPSRDLIVAAHHELTREWWERALPKLEPFVSPFVIDEVSRGDPGAAKERLEAIASFSVLGVPVEVEELAQQYFTAIDIPERARIDSLHLAIAAWHGMDYLVSWNCTHIASARVRRIMGAINDGLDIRTPIICTPEELMEV
jgi:predicted nucleic acid-binding protein